MSLFNKGALLLLLLASGIAACGFQLQGALTMPPSMQRTYIQTDDRYSPFYRALRRDLAAAGVDVVDSASEASAIFTIYSDLTDQRVLSVSARNVPTEYEVFYTVRYGLIAGSETLLVEQDMTMTQDYTYDATLVLGKAREEQSMRDAIVDDLVRTVLRQVAVR